MRTCSFFYIKIPKVWTIYDKTQMHFSKKRFFDMPRRNNVTPWKTLILSGSQRLLLGQRTYAHAQAPHLMGGSRGSFGAVLERFWGGSSLSGSFGHKWVWWEPFWAEKVVLRPTTGSSSVSASRRASWRRRSFTETLGPATVPKPKLLIQPF